MKKVILIMLTAILLCGCQKTQIVSGSAKEEETVELKEPQTEKSEETTAGQEESVKEDSKSGELSRMHGLSPDASLEDLLGAFKEDYARAAKQAGVSSDHNDLTFEPVEDDMVTMTLDGGIMLILKMAPQLKMVWYAGYPEDDESFLQEMQLVLMAADNTLTPEDAMGYAQDIWEDGWDNRNNMPSSVDKHLPSGVLYTFSINDRKLISFQIAYQQ